jgi:photosystem II stability/assembly factor-like uncharacterized protein
MRTFLYSILTIFLFGSASVLNAQKYTNLIKTNNPTFFEIQDAFRTYWNDKNPEKGSGYNQFKRWEWYWETRVNSDGTFPSSNSLWEEWNNYVALNPESTNSRQQIGTWKYTESNISSGSNAGMGRISCIAFHPQDVNTFWAGSPDGGLWKTTNGGKNWTTNNSNLPILGVTDIAVDPKNPHILYIATGAGNLGSLSALTGPMTGDTKSIGILKSLNDGHTWNLTGLNWNEKEPKLITRLLINPNNPQILIAASSDGIWRTTNGGSSWTKSVDGYFMDIEFNPIDPEIVYAATYSKIGKAAMYRSINGGAQWTLVTTLNNVSRVNIAVTKAAPKMVDAVCANTDGGLAGLIYSMDNGASFSTYFNADCKTNLLHHSYNASGCGGQGWYNLAYAINPTNSYDYWLGGINTWNSKNGGSTWDLKTCWDDTPSNNPNRVPKLNSSKHLLVFHPLNSNILFECNNGGIFKTEDKGITWTNLSNGLGISQIYKIGVSQINPNQVMCGLQDNGLKEFGTNNEQILSSVDGMECIYDYSDSKIKYASTSNGAIFRTLNNWSTKEMISTNIPGGQPHGAWVTPIVIDPQSPATIYAGYELLYKSTNRGNTWNAISPVLCYNHIRNIAIAPSNSHYIYATSLDTLFFTNDGGITWKNYSFDILDAKITGIAINSNNPESLWITLSGYNVDHKVYSSNDGGTTWNNISGTLPNLSVNCIVYQKNSNNSLYIGTDVGVFYRDDNMNDWVRFQNGLPNVPITELEISYADNTLWAATLGRGLWSSDLFSGFASTTDEMANTDFMIYPNPGSGIFNLETYNMTVQGIEVFDISGKKILFQTTPDILSLNINLTNQLPGTYFVNVLTTDQKNITKKVVLNK